MKHIRLLAVILSVLMALSPVNLSAWAEEETPAAQSEAQTEAPATEAPATEAPATEVPATEVPATEVPATEVPATEVPATEVPATEVPATEVPATEVPATEVPATEVPATDVPATEVPATEVPATEAPATTVPAATETAAPVVTAAPIYPRIVFDPYRVIYDASNLKQGGCLIVALPIGYEESSGRVIWSDVRNPDVRWEPTAEPHPGYFSQQIVPYLTEGRWEAEGRGFRLSSVFHVEGTVSGSIIHHAPEGNDWNMEEGAPFSMGYAVFLLPVREDAPNGEYVMTFRLDMPGNVMNEDEEIEYSMLFSLGAAPTVTETATTTPEPTETPEPTPTYAPDDGDDDGDWGDDGDDEGDWGDEGLVGMGSIMMGESSVQTVKVKQTGVQLAVPVSYVYDNRRIYSNHSDEGTVVKPGQDSSAYSADILDYVEWLEISVTPETAASDAFPFQMSEQGVAKTVIADGENYGYAVFDNLTVKRNLANGSMTVPLSVRWIESGSADILTTELYALVNITGASSGGGGGGGSYYTPTTPPQARVLVESINSDPETVKAGDQFELVFSLRNTSTTQYVQNMRLTVSSEEDVLIPLSGSNTLYIDRIDADSSYELRYPVRASMEVPDHPIRVEVSIEYEDSKVAAQSASQTLVINVEQNRRIKIDEPVLDNVAPMVGDSVTASMQVINEGRTTLYNVTVTAQCESEEIILPVSSYLGNMEGGTSKKAELDLMPLAAGDYNVTLQVSYEDAMGMQYTETRMANFFAQEETYFEDPFYDPFYQEPEVYEEPGLTVETVMQMLPWQVYAAGGGLLTVIIVLMGLGARSRRRKALEDDEMD